MGKLEEYRRKRNFRHTSEPAGGEQATTPTGWLFVVHKHAASHDHFDLRLEQDGVLRSWALPKGPSLKPGEKRLAVEVEDHPLEYADFEGVIPEKSYGGGTSMLWDRGRWVARGRRTKDRIDFELDGEKLRGAWTLSRMQRGEKDARQWLLIKRRDEGRSSMTVEVDDDRSVATGRTMREIAEDRDAVWTADGASTRRAALPEPGSLRGAQQRPLARDVRPQLATLAREAPDGEKWLHEIKFDGYRIMARLENGEARLITRNSKDWTHRFPELARTLAQLPVDSALLDGEVVSLAADGTSSFRRLQEALSGGRTASLVYQAFDLLYLQGWDLSEVPLVERKRSLAQLLEASRVVDHGSVRYSDHIEARGPAFFEQACRMGLEGIISKRASSVYQSTRSKEWLKTKCANHEEFVVGGYTDPGGSRDGFGALLMGAFTDEGALEYAGRVGTGFNARLLEQLTAMLEELATGDSPFNGPVPGERSVHWVRPEMVIEVEFTERTRDGRLRHPAFRGLREDRNPEEIRAAPGAASAMGQSGDTSDEPAPGARSPARKRGPQGEARVLGVRLTHADRVLYPEQGLTKLDLARFYESIQDWILPRLIERPLSLLRCPEGRTGECFFQKHPRVAIPASVPRVDIPEKSGRAEYVYVQSAADLVGLVQAGALEIHPWGSRIADVERPDTLVFDLDPDPGVAWQEVLRAAGTLRERLATLGLTGFVRTTGGKGLHVVVPIVPSVDWDAAKAFAKAIAQQHARDDPRRLTANMSKSKRAGRIFIDYLRNGRGATAVASYSVRARENAPICVPVRWEELNSALRADRYTVENLRRRLAALRDDPWAGYEEAARPLTDAMRKAVGLPGR